MAKKRTSKTNGRNGHAAAKPNGHGHSHAAEPAIRVKATLRTAPLRSPLPANRGGRPTKYKPDMARQAALMVENGMTDAQICKVLGISVVTMWKWTHKHAEFVKALARSKEQMMALAEHSLFVGAVGYNVPATKVFMPAGFDQPVYAHYEEHIPGDAAKMRLYLYNNNPEKYRERLQIEDVTVETEAQKRYRQIAVKALLELVEDRKRRGLPPIFATEIKRLPVLPIDGEENG